MIRNYLRSLTSKKIYDRFPHKNDHLELVSRVIELSIEIERLKRNLNLQKRVTKSFPTLVLRLQKCSYKPNQIVDVLDLVSQQECLLAIDAKNNLYLTPENDLIITPEINKTGYWEENVSLLLEKILPGIKTFLVIGANFGYHAIQQAKNNPQLRIIAIEPHPKTFELLKSNCGLNKIEIELFNLAITEKKGTITLYESEFNGGNNRIEPFQESKMIGNVNSNSIQNFLEELGLFPDLFLIDMQGNEIETALSIFKFQMTKTICIFELDIGNKGSSQNYFMNLTSNFPENIEFSILDRDGRLLHMSRAELVQRAIKSSEEDLIIVASN